MLPVTSCLVPFLLLAHFSGASSVYFNFLRRKDSSCPADAQEPWSYCGDNGPQNWGRNYSDCNGNSQSPININKAQVMPDPNLVQLQLVNYDVPVSSASILNNGHTMQITPTDAVPRSIEVEGSQYNLTQLHFHWGNGYKRGSEHTIDNRAYALEVHFVHRNEEGGLAVVGVLFQEIGIFFRGCNAELEKILSVSQEVMYKDESTQLNNSGLILNGLLPENPAPFYRYHGSLTTPGCTEGVIWSVLKEHQHVCHRQMKQFRRLHSDSREENNKACHINNNYRPVQPLNGRNVTGSQ